MVYLFLSAIVISMQHSGDREGVHKDGQAAVGSGAGVSALAAALELQQRARRSGSCESEGGDVTHSAGGDGESVWLGISHQQREALTAEADACSAELIDRIGEPPPAEAARAEAFVDASRFADPATTQAASG